MNEMGFANALGTASSAFLGIAIVLAVIALLLFFVFDIRAVRDELTGRTAARAIATMRSTTWAERRLRESSARKLLETTGDFGHDEAAEEAALTVRSAKADTPSATSESLTTIFDPQAASESMTTLLGTPECQASETATTLLPDADHAESITTLITVESQKENR